MSIRSGSNGVVLQPRLTSDRYASALGDRMDVERVAGQLYAVTTETGRYTVDLETAACDCPDCFYRGDDVRCKHAIRCAFAETYANTVSTAFVARVVAYACENGCPFGTSGCNGPVRRQDDTPIPCASCMNGVRANSVDEWTVFERLAGEFQ